MVSVNTQKLPSLSSPHEIGPIFFYQAVGVSTGEEFINSEPANMYSNTILVYHLIIYLAQTTTTLTPIPLACMHMT
jgi:hypothetical protein